MYYNDCVWARASDGKVEGQCGDYVDVCSASTVTYLCKPHLLYRPFFRICIYMFRSMYLGQNPVAIWCLGK